MAIPWEFQIRDYGEDIWGWLSRGGLSKAQIVGEIAWNYAAHIDGYPTGVPDAGFSFLEHVARTNVLAVFEELERIGYIEKGPKGPQRTARSLLEQAFTGARVTAFRTARRIGGDRSRPLSFESDQDAAVFADEMLMQGMEVDDPKALKELQLRAAKKNPRKKKKAKKRAKKKVIKKKPKPLNWKEDGDGYFVKVTILKEKVEYWLEPTSDLDDKNVWAATAYDPTIEILPVDLPQTLRSAKKAVIEDIAERRAARRNPRKKNPIGKRLDYVRKQYKPEVFELTQEFVAHALKVSPEEIDPDRREEWESSITWLATQINRLLKARDKGGANVESELHRLRASYLDTVRPFFGRPKRKGVRRPELAQMSPKEARKYGARVDEGRFEKKQDQAGEAGYRIVKGLGGGYVAVEGVPNLDAPPFPKDDGLRGLLYQGANEKQWAEENAKFQQWLGVEMKNCLQFHQVNYVAYGKEKFEVQRKGGKLYAILDPQGKPVAAILVDSQGQVIETNGPNNQPAPESVQPYLEKFGQVMGLAVKEGQTFIAPAGFDEQVAAIIERFLDTELIGGDPRAQRRFVRKTQGYARQAGADFSRVWPKLALHLLDESKYSALNSAMGSIPRGALIDDRSTRAAVIRSIQEVAQLYRHGGPPSAFRSAANNGEAASAAIEVPTDEYVIGVPATRALKRAALVAIEAAYAERGASYSPTQAQSAASAVANASAAAGSSAMHTSMVAEQAIAPVARYAKGEMAGQVGWDASLQDYAEKFLSLMREAASDAGRNLQQGAPRPNPRPRTDGLIAQCQANWDHYLARPGKKRLKAVLDHLEVMKGSKSAKVRQERRRCLRVANQEASELEKAMKNLRRRLKKGR